MSRDVKISYLKSLQGYLWETGYQNGQLKCPLFSDVAPKFAEWTSNGVRIIIYSSGSVAAQKLLFAHTKGDPSDLTGLIAGYFDIVNAGPKTDPSSYEKIAATHSDCPVNEWLFLSDNVQEVEAAKQAGMRSYVVERPGNARLSEVVRSQHRVIKAFNEL